MIKVDNLMIGDWLLDGDSYAQVTSIACGGIIETTASNFASEEVLQPIPLTLKILKANGFNINWGDGFLRVGEGESSYHIRYFTHRRFKAIGIKAPHIKLDVQITFVHELQHIFRQVGLTELADNIKVE